MKPNASTIHADVGVTMRQQIHDASPGVTLRALTIALFATFLRSVTGEGSDPSLLMNILQGTAVIVAVPNQEECDGTKKP